MGRQDRTNLHRRQLVKLELELRNHPAQARDRRTNEPLFYDDEETKPVPLITDQRAIYLNGIMVGYCGTEAGKPLTMTTRLDQALEDAVTQFVTDKVGKPKLVNRPPRQELVAQAEREFDEPTEDEGDSAGTDLEDDS